jgi:transposase
MTISGVGPVTALALCALIGPIARFARPNKLVGYLGLDPRVRQSGEHVAWTGHISRQGQAHARGLLVEAALGAVDSAGPLRAFYLRVRARRGAQVAAVAAARKLAVIMWHLLTKRSEYRWSPSVLIAQKRRRLELAAGAPTRPRTASQGPSQRERLRQERAQCEVAEQEYRELVRERSGAKRDAAAATGARR